MVVDTRNEPAAPARARAQHIRAIRSVMFCDVVKSTHLLDRLGDLGWLDVVDRHAEVVDRLAAAHHGQVTTFLGDGFMVMFPSATAALACALELQDETAADSQVDLRIGIDHGSVHSLRADWWVGRTIHIASRITDFCEAGNIALTDRCLSAACDDGATPETTLRFLHVRGFRDPSFVHVIDHPGVVRDATLDQPIASPIANSAP